MSTLDHVANAVSDAGRLLPIELQDHWPSGFEPLINTAPSKPDALIIVADAGSESPYRDLAGGSIERPKVAIYVRHPEDGVCEATCRFIYDELKHAFFGHQYSRAFDESPNRDPDNDGRAVWNFAIGLMLDTSSPFA